MSTTSAQRTYEGAVSLLNSLQSNASTLQALAVAGNWLNQLSIPEMLEYLKRINFTLEDVDKLSVIHVTGTKGKGSTSAFCETLVRAYGFKTGLYVSPHLQEVRERIRINGVPLSKELFGKYFFEVWDLLEKNKDMPSEVELPSHQPTYFRFLTLLAFHVFREEKVDATVLEVGIGGSYDATNVVKRPVACGIVSIGLDHEAVLGNTVASVANHKGGILKPSVPGFTDLQSQEATEVLSRKALELKAPLYYIPKLSSYTGYSPSMKLGIAGDHQLSNAALALALAKTWNRFHKGELSPENFTDPGLKEASAVPFETVLTPTEIKALEATSWEGRCQVINLPERSLKLYVDGAHTLESLAACTTWFRESIPANSPRALIFNCSFDRNPGRLLHPIQDIHKENPFTEVVFCPNTPFSGPTSSVDTINHMAPPNPDLGFQSSLKQAWDGLGSVQATVAPSVSDALHHLETARKGLKVGNNNEPLHVLITGSLHLVGATFNALKFVVR